MKKIRLILEDGKKDRMVNYDQFLTWLDEICSKIKYVSN